MSSVLFCFWMVAVLVDYTCDHTEQVMVLVCWQQRWDKQQPLVVFSLLWPLYSCSLFSPMASPLALASRVPAPPYVPLWYLCICVRRLLDIRSFWKCVISPGAGQSSVYNDLHSHKRSSSKKDLLVSFSPQLWCHCCICLRGSADRLICLTTFLFLGHYLNHLIYKKKKNLSLLCLPATYIPLQISIYSL